ncbi:DLH domain-containing protein [Aphelenchoides bicaudatus]|nr:DLH domain-containing protein [Aphelenchoides bicaudatus]
MKILVGYKSYNDAQQSLRGFLARPKHISNGYRLPVVIVLHDVMGLTDFEIKRTKFIASNGLIGFGGDIYGKHIKNETLIEGQSCAKVYVENRNTLLRSRLNAAINFVKTLPFVDCEKIAAIGFGFGGLCVLDCARNNLGIKCGVVFHGHLEPMHDYISVDPIEAKLLVCYGDQDTNRENDQEVENLLVELRDRRADFQFVRYSNVEDDFSLAAATPELTTNAMHSKKADKRSSQSIKMSIVCERKTYKDGDKELEGVLCYPKNASGKLPTVLVWHAFLGLSEHDEAIAKKLAEIGFLAFAANVYGKGVLYKTREEGFAALNEYRTARSTLLRGRLLAALNFVKTLPNVDHQKIASIGFCFGGMCSLDLARINSGISCAVSFHGAFQPIDGETDFASMDPIKAKLLICHGDEDQHVNPTVDAFIDELRARNADFQFVRYSHAKHGFTMESHKNDTMPGIGYHELTKNRSYAAMLLLFNELYGLPKLEHLHKL